MSWEGTAGGRETHRWTHVCVSVAYTRAGAVRRVAVDGVMTNVTVTSDYFRSASSRHTVYSSASKSSIRRFVITKKASARAFS